MSTENNLQTIYENSIKILTDLIAFKTISGEDNSPLIDYCDNILNSLGAESFRTYDDEKKRVNLFSTLKSKIGNGKIGVITKELQSLFMDTVMGKNKKFRSWLKFI